MKRVTFPFLNPYLYTKNGVKAGNMNFSGPEGFFNINNHILNKN